MYYRRDDDKVLHSWTGGTETEKLFCVHGTTVAQYKCLSYCYCSLFVMHWLPFICVTCLWCACAGNTCFLNCILQVLYYTPTFVENVDVLVKEMKATITDYNLIKTVAVSMNEW